LIEDDEDDYLVTRRLLVSIYGDRLVLDWVKTYEVALDVLARRTHDVCLLDYRLGLHNGIELLREVSAENFPIPIILMTGQGDREIDEEAAQAGASDYLLKGQTDVSILERAIRYAIQQKQSEEARIQLVREREARALAEEANRTKDAFLAMITHELRAPLNSILGWIGILRTRPVDEAMRRHAFDIIEQSARTQSHLIEDILDTARITSGKLRLDIRPIVLSELIQDAIEVVRPAAEAKGIEIERRFDQHLNVISGDPDRIQQVVWNLLSNAIKFTPDGGRVGINLERADPHARITVTDTGKGIAPEFLPYIFERFAQQPTQTKGTRRKSGLGLGLSLSKHLVELHGGTIEASSEGEGQGSTFTIYFPIGALRPKTGDLKQHAAQTEKSEEGALLLAGLRVLVVDDEEDARNLVAAVLQQCGAEVSLAASANEALTALQSGVSYDVLVSDIGMPGSSGYDLIQCVRALAPERGGLIPALALTAFGRTTDRVRALAAGFQTHISKPVEPEELVVVVASLSGRAAHGIVA
jgi:two-component system CheB/CheR fusion protein